VTWELPVLCLSALVAGAVNSVAGGGTLLTFPALIAALGSGEDHLGLPADFLIASDGCVVARKYGRHADDQWSVDEIVELANRWVVPPAGIDPPVLGQG